MSIIIKAVLFQGQHGVIPFQNGVGPNNGQYQNQNSEFEGVQFVLLLLLPKYSLTTISSRSEYNADEVDYPAPEVDYPYQVGNKVEISNSLISVNLKLGLKKILLNAG